MTAHTPAKVDYSVAAADIWGPFSPWPRAAPNTAADPRAHARSGTHAA